MVKLIRRVSIQLVSLSRPYKCFVMMAADFVAAPLLMYIAYAIRFGEWLPIVKNDLRWMLVLAPVATLPLLYASGFYKAAIRFLDSKIAWVITRAVTVACLFMASVAFAFHISGVPRSALFNYWLLAVLYLLGSRFLLKRYLAYILRDRAGRIDVAIYGAGGAGVQLSLALQNATRYLPRFFIDDDKRLQGTIIQGIKVVGRERAVGALRRYSINTVLLAMPSVARHARMDIVHFLEGLRVQVKSVPALPDIVAGRARIEDIKSIDVEDLLRRTPVLPDLQLLRAPVAGRSVLVTGAGGSIGSELCRQVLAQGPRKLVMFERNEYALYKLDQELRGWLRDHARDTEIIPVLGSVVSQRRIEDAYREYGVQTVFHAAAYKHVPMVEANPIEGVENNIFGTLRAAQAAVAAGVERFVMISTDKAVRPTNVMGATKRFGEMVLQALAERGGKTIFTMVRFGNVLGSSGSVVPLFRKQILAGGPVTLTHRDITRYFMTIPEAAQLVIQAGAMAVGGEVFVLDMGEPIKIYDLACTMVRLMGSSVRDEHHPDGDIEIAITGLRPGEKLYEELLIGDNCTHTRNPMIMRAQESHVSWSAMQLVMTSLNEQVRKRNIQGVLELLQTYVNGYHPAANGAICNVNNVEQVHLGAL